MALQPTANCPPTMAHHHLTTLFRRFSTAEKNLNAALSAHEELALRNSPAAPFAGSKLHALQIAYDQAKADYDAYAATCPDMAAEYEARHEAADLRRKARHAERLAQHVENATLRRQTRAQSRAPRAERRAANAARALEALTQEQTLLAAERDAFDLAQHRTHTARARANQRHNFVLRRLQTIGNLLTKHRRALFAAQQSIARHTALPAPQSTPDDHRLTARLLREQADALLAPYRDRPSLLPPRKPRGVQCHRPCPRHVADRYAYDARTGALTGPDGLPLAPTTTTVSVHGERYPVLAVIATLLDMPGARLRRIDTSRPPALDNLRALTRATLNTPPEELA